MRNSFRPPTFRRSPRRALSPSTASAWTKLKTSKASFTCHPREAPLSPIHWRGMVSNYLLTTDHPIRQGQISTRTAPIWPVPGAEAVEAGGGSPRRGGYESPAAPIRQAAIRRDRGLLELRGRGLARSRKPPPRGSSHIEHTPRSAQRSSTGKSSNPRQLECSAEGGPERWPLPHGVTAAPPSAASASPDRFPPAPGHASTDALDSPGTLGYFNN